MWSFKRIRFVSTYIYDDVLLSVRAHVHRLARSVAPDDFFDYRILPDIDDYLRDAGSFISVERIDALDNSLLGLLRLLRLPPGNFVPTGRGAIDRSFVAVTRLQGARSILNKRLEL